MKKSELIAWLNDPDAQTKKKDPEIEIWISATEKLKVLSVYTDTKKTKIWIDVALE